MKIGETKLLSENIAPSNALSLAIFNGDTKVCDIDISKMQPTNLGSKMYSFGLLSDVHCAGNSNGGTATDDGNGIGTIPNGTYFNRALTYFESQNVDFCCVSGDLTNIGFYWEKDDTEVYLNQFAEYKNICGLHPDLPVYEICGNHENYYGRRITENLDLLEEYTGQGVSYTMTYGDDVFIFAGESESTLPISSDTSFTEDDGEEAFSTYNTFSWLSKILESNKEKRCFVFIHPYVDKTDSGNPLGLHATPLFDYWGSTKKNAFINLMASYPNAILFHGHSHMDFENQLTVKNANYSTTLGFKSVHIPSTAYTRNVSTGAIEESTNGAQGYICEVYEKHIVLKGYDFQHEADVPIAQYCLDTTLQTIEANTYTDI